MVWKIQLFNFLFYSSDLDMAIMAFMPLFFKHATGSTPIMSLLFMPFLSLSKIMNQQNWEAMGPLLDKIPAIKPVYVLFTICSTWALLSVLTGVVSDNMMSVRESQAQKDEEVGENHGEFNALFYFHFAFYQICFFSFQGFHPGFIVTRPWKNGVCGSQGGLAFGHGFFGQQKEGSNLGSVSILLDHQLISQLELSIL